MSREMIPFTERARTATEGPRCFAVVGRVHGDDEDQVRVVFATDPDDARAWFRNAVLTAAFGPEYGRMDPPKFETDWCHVVHVLSAAAQIEVE